MLSKFYIKNVKQANKWLKENAPDYVNKCIEDLNQFMSDLSERTLKAEKAVQVIEKGFYKGIIAINKLEQLSNEIQAHQEASSANLNTLCDDLEATVAAAEPDELP